MPLYKKHSIFRFLVLILIFPIAGCSQEKQILLQDYSFLAVDGEVSKIHQRNDTLYFMKCYVDRPCQPEPRGHFKILSTKKSDDLILLKLERLDTIPLTTDPYPATRFSIIVLKKVDSIQLGLLSFATGLTKKKLDTIQINFNSLKDKFYFTYYSDGYLEKVSQLKKVTTLEDANEIVETAFNSDNYKSLTEAYKRSDVIDFYASGISAELLTRACVDNGYNPIGAGRVINKLMREYRNQKSDIN